MPSAFIQEATEFLRFAGYDHGNVVVDCRFSARSDSGKFRDSQIDLVAFAQKPHDMRSACIAAFDSRIDIEAVLGNLRFLTTPLALVGHPEKVELWSVRKTLADSPFDVIDRLSWSSRLNSRLADFLPRTIIGAKDDRIQLEFVDAGLNSWAKSITSTSLRSLLEDLIHTGINSLPYRRRFSEEVQNDVMRLVFHLFACRALEDKGIIDRKQDAESSLREAHLLFSENINPQVIHSPNVTKAMADSMFARLRSEFSFATLTSDILSYSYENALVTKKGRREHGIYYTPRPVTEYILRRLPVEMIPETERVLWDPCCGCGSFLVAGFDRLSELLPTDWLPSERHDYLRQRILGSDRDAFARELASLALVLTDLHNRNGWNVYQFDASQVTSGDLPITPSIVTTNLPFKEIKEGKGERRELSAEILSRLLDITGAESLFGVILPQSFLDSRAAGATRRKILDTCDILEIDLLPGAFFESAAETAVLLLRKRSRRRITTTTVRELRSSEFQIFMRKGSFTRTYPVDPLDWEADPETRFHVSPLSDLWKRLEGGSPPLNHVAIVRNGLQIKKDDTVSVSDKQRDDNDKPFIDRLDVLRPFALLTEAGIPREKWIRYGPQLHRTRSQEIFQAEKVLINSNRNPGSAWRLVAAISHRELYFSDNFHAVIPRHDVTAEQIAAVLNSPIANAWFDSRCKKRKVVQSILEKLPFPEFDQKIGSRLNDAVREMQHAVVEKWNRAAEGMFYDGLVETRDTAELLSEIDLIVYESYGLSAFEVKQVDNLMSTDKRPG